MPKVAKAIQSRSRARQSPDGGRRDAPACRSHQRLCHRRQDRQVWRNHQGPASAPGPAAVDRGSEGAAGRADGEDGHRRQEGIRGAADEHEQARGTRAAARRVETGVDERDRPQGAGLSRRGQYREQVGGEQPDRHGRGRRGEVPEIRRPDRTRRVAAGRESTGARSAGSHPEQRHSEAAIQGQGSVLALRQRRRAWSARRWRRQRGRRNAASRFPKKRAGSAIVCSV